MKIAISLASRWHCARVLWTTETLWRGFRLLCVMLVSWVRKTRKFETPPPWYTCTVQEKGVVVSGKLDSSGMSAPSLWRQASQVVPKFWVFGVAACKLFKHERFCSLCTPTRFWSWSAEEILFLLALVWHKCPQDSFCPKWDTRGKRAVLHTTLTKDFFRLIGHKTSRHNSVQKLFQLQKHAMLATLSKHFNRNVVLTSAQWDNNARTTHGFGLQFSTRIT